jgi:hypothetical protein
MVMLSLQLALKPGRYCLTGVFKSIFFSSVSFNMAAAVKSFEIELIEKRVLGLKM